MRDPERIVKVLEEIKNYWQQYPDLRLGQLICNAIPPNDDLFYIEDEILIELLKNRYLQKRKSMKNGNPCPICDKGILAYEIVNETFEYKGQEITVEDYEIYTCPSCKEVFVSENSVKKVIEILKNKTPVLFVAKKSLK